MARSTAKFSSATVVGLFASLLTFASLLVGLDSPSAESASYASGGLNGSFSVLMTSTAVPDYAPPGGSSPSLKLLFSNRAFRNNLEMCGSFPCRVAAHRNGSLKSAEMTVVIGPGSDESNGFHLVSGTALPVGFQFAGRAGRPGNPGLNPVNLAGAPDYGTETIHVCYQTVFIGGFSDTCKWMREAKAVDTNPGRAYCPAYNSIAEVTYGRDGTNGTPHVALLTNDAGPVNRTWGPIPGGTADPSDYNHPNGRLWDVRRQKWAYARWTSVTCAGLTVGGLGGSQAIAAERSIFIYKDEPSPGAWTFSIMPGDDDRMGAVDFGGWAQGFTGCGSVLSTPVNPCRTTYELALQMDLGGAVEVGRTWPTCGGSHTLGASFADRVTFPGHTVASVEVVPEETPGTPCSTSMSGDVENASNSRVTAYRVSDGTQVANTFTDGTGSWSTSLQMSPCAAPGGGYKVYAEAPSGYQSAWYPSATNYSSAECVTAPEQTVNMTLAASGPVTGYVKDAATAADINGAVVYAFREADGSFAGWSSSGSAGPGRYSIALAPGTPYRLKVHPPSGYSGAWFDGAQTYSNATPTTAPSTANFSVGASTAYLRGYVKDSETAADLDNAYVYVYDAGSGQFLASGKTGGASGSGRYQIPVPVASGYKILAKETSHENLWLDGAPGYAEATATAATDNANFSLRPAGVISGYALQGGVGVPNALVSAYTLCGCTTPQNVVSNSAGYYELRVPATAATGNQYKVRFIAPGGSTLWYSNSPSFGGAAAVNSPPGLPVSQAFP